MQPTNRGRICALKNLFIFLVKVGEILVQGLIGMVKKDTFSLCEGMVHGGEN